MSIHPLPIILASTSKSRVAVLDQSGLSYTISESNFDEKSITDTNPDKRVIALAKAKCEAVNQKRKQPALIIGADTVVLLNNKVLEKPKYKMTALAMLKELSGQIHTVLTGFAVYNSYKETWESGVSKTYVTFRALSHKEITDYVNDNPVTQWAGGYNPHLSSAVTFITHVEGSLTGLRGLPLEKIIPIIHYEWAHPYRNRTK